MKLREKIIVLFLVLTLLLITKNVNAETLTNDIEVQPETNLTYYLDVSYDGVDIEGINSSSSVTSNVQSGIIYVEDRIPDGLEFIRICNNRIWNNWCC